MRKYELRDAIELIHMLKDSDELAFEELYRRYWRPMFAVAANKMHELPIAEEIVQDIFTNLWIRRESLELKGPLENYLAVAVKYKVIDARLKRSRKMALENFAAAKVQDAVFDTEQAVLFEELKDRLAVLVQALPEKARLVYQLSREEGHSTKEIATMLEIHEKSVEYHLTKALKTLRAGMPHLFFLFI